MEAYSYGYIEPTPPTAGHGIKLTGAVMGHRLYDIEPPYVDPVDSFRQRFPEIAPNVFQGNFGIVVDFNSKEVA